MRPLMALLLLRVGLALRLALALGIGMGMGAGLDPGTRAEAAEASQAAQVNVAVAANFSAPMQQIARSFEQETGHKVLVSVGSTGGLYAQIRNGAPFDAFLAADDETPARLEREGLGLPGTRVTYATGRLVLWSRQAGVVDEQGAVLGTGAIQRLAVANPKLAPYGAAAMQVLQSLKPDRELAQRLVLADNVAQAHQFVSSGNATAGFVAASQVLVAGQVTQGSAWLVPASLHSPIRQDAVLLVRAKGQAAAQAFMSHLKSAKVRTIIEAYGYEP